MIDEPLKFLCIITERRRADKVIALLNEEGVTYHSTLLGSGTAPSDIAELMSLYDAEKSVILCVLRADKITPVFSRLKTEQEFGAGGGFAFTARLSSASSVDAIRFLIDGLQ